MAGRLGDHLETAVHDDDRWTCFLGRWAGLFVFRCVRSRRGPQDTHRALDRQWESWTPSLSSDPVGPRWSSSNIWQSWMIHQKQPLFVNGQSLGQLFSGPWSCSAFECRGEFHLEFLQGHRPQGQENATGRVSWQSLVERSLCMASYPCHVAMMFIANLCANRVLAGQYVHCNLRI